MLRSPYGSILSKMEDHHTVHDLSALSQGDYNLIYLLMSISGNSARSEDLYGMNGMMQDLFPNAVKATNQLIQKGYLVKEASLDSALNTLTLPKLKELLKSKQLSLTGKKADLITRLKSSLSEQETIQIRNSRPVWIPTPLGYEYLYSLYLERKTMEKLALNAFMAKSFSSACSIIYDYKDRIPVSGALSIGGDGKTHRDCAALLAFHFSHNEMDSIAAVACFEYISGETLLYPPEGNTLSAEAKDDIVLKRRYISFALSTEAELQSCRDARIEYYEVLCQSDSCNLCKKASRVEHKVADAEIGKNAPPFHLGCRCAIIACIDD